MRHDNPDLQVGDGPAPGYPYLGRVLLQTESVISPTGSVTLVLNPDVPGTNATRQFTRYQIELDGIGAVQDLVDLQARFKMNGVLATGVDDYQYAFHSHTSNNNGSVYEDTGHTSMIVSGGFNDARYGSDSDSTFSYSMWLDPGVNSTQLPRIKFEASGYTSAQVVANLMGTGLYDGKTTLQFGRAEEIQFTMTADSIERGTFRLYGTE